MSSSLFLVGLILANGGIIFSAVVSRLRVRSVEYAGFGAGLA